MLKTYYNYVYKYVHTYTYYAKQVIKVTQTDLACDIHNLSLWDQL